MRRTLHTLLLCAAVSLSLLSCNVFQDVKDPSALELTLSATSLTRGVVPGATLVDDATGDRPLYVAAYLHAQDGPDGQYLTGDRFDSDGGVWRRSPSVYWPIGGRLDLLAYSTCNPVPDEDIIWGSVNNAERLRIRVGADRTQDDILYGSAWDRSATGLPTDMAMNHSQAWIEVRFTSLFTGADAVTVDAVTLTDIYLAGILDIENNYGAASHEWDFRSVTKADRPVDDPDAVLGTVLGSTPVSMGMLIPEQGRTSLRVTYTKGGTQLVSTFPLSHSTWVAGQHYVYDITFQPPLVTFTTAVLSGFSPASETVSGVFDII